MTLATARPMDFQDFVNFKFEQGLSPTSIAKFHSIMHKCLKYAVALQIIPNNPADNVAMLPKRRRFPPRTGLYDRAQLNVFLAAALQSPAEAAFVLAASYGLRRSECAGLRWSAIDFRARRMVINHTAILSNGRILYVDNVKTRSSYRTLPLSGLAAAVSDRSSPPPEGKPPEIRQKPTTRAIMSASVRTARRSARTIFPASSGASAAAPVCRASGFTICGIRSRRSCFSRAFPLSRFRNGSVIRISPRPQTFTRTCRMWRRSLSPRARFRSSKSERCKIIPAFQSA